jgi:hypothetical protein
MNNKYDDCCKETCEPMGEITRNMNTLQNLIAGNGELISILSEKIYSVIADDTPKVNNGIASDESVRNESVLGRYLAERTEELIICNSRLNSLISRVRL